MEKIRGYKAKTRGEERWRQREKGGGGEKRRSPSGPTQIWNSGSQIPQIPVTHHPKLVKKRFLSKHDSSRSPPLHLVPLFLLPASRYPISCLRLSSLCTPSPAGFSHNQLITTALTASAFEPTAHNHNTLTFAFSSTSNHFSVHWQEDPSLDLTMALTWI